MTLELLPLNWFHSVLKDVKKNFEKGTYLRQLVPPLMIKLIYIYLFISIKMIFFAKPKLQPLYNAISMPIPTEKHS